jgi:nucleoside-diphosphate kinase
LQRAVLACTIVSIITFSEGEATMAETQSTMTFAIIKPDAVRAGKIGGIIQRITDHGFKIRALKMVHMSRPVAEGFYAVHRERPFFNDLVQFMTSGPSVVMALEKENAVQAWRDLMGPTDATKAPKGTIRGDFGTSIQENATHGSDSSDNATSELSYFFNAMEFS